MKSCVIIYHKNAAVIYKQEWIDKCINSIREQTLQDFDVFELNYGIDNNKYYEGSFFSSLEMPNHIHAMNALIHAALKSNYDVIFNVNLDDYYAPKRFELQVKEIMRGAQLVSSNFYYFSDEKGVFKNMNMNKYVNLDIQFRRNHNVIAHPVVAYHKSFFDGGLTYKDKLGYEDLVLWKEALAANKRFVILPDYLLHYRIHENQITKTHIGL